MTDDEAASLQISPVTPGPDPYTVPAPHPMEQMDAIRKRHGEGRHKTLAAMITETLSGDR